MRSIKVGLVGNPNCGKTTVFNALTGSNQRIGNWPGVTVECKSGSFDSAEANVNVVDLPGLYSLVSVSTQEAIDTKIACQFIQNTEVDLIINVIDAASLERHLYLTAQLLDMQVPVIIVLNMMDVAAQQDICIDIAGLEKQLGCPIVTLTAHKGQGIQSLKEMIVEFAKQPIVSTARSPFPDAVVKAIDVLQTELIGVTHNPRYLALQLLEDDYNAKQKISADSQIILQQQQKYIQQSLQEDADIIIADYRYNFVHAISQHVLSKQPHTMPKWTTWIDNIVLNRVLGLPIFLLVMYTMFLFAINIGGIFQDFFDIASEALFVQGLANVLQQWHTPVWLTAVIASGVGKGINTTLTFIPVLSAMYFFLAFLEGSGYMARAAFVMDRVMQAIGLPGKSFVPMIVGFGCNVPGIMATRTLEHYRDRVLTIMMSPFMSCGARLAIYAVFTSAFFPHGGQNVVFALYLIGILVAVMTGLILRSTVLKGERSALVIELPVYHLPTFKALGLQTWQRIQRFVWRAGKVILPVCVLIGVLNAISLDGQLIQNHAQGTSLLAALGQLLTPLFAPMGITADNWPATVGLLTGTLAKEVVIATLNTLYTHVAHFTTMGQQSGTVLLQLKAALLSIPENIKALSQAFHNPFLANAPQQSLDVGVYGVMYERFHGPVAAFAYLLFVLLYIPCVATAAVIARELNRRWAIFSVLWSLGLAYIVAVVFYQIATFVEHPYQAVTWLIVLILGFCGVMYVLKYLAKIHDNDQPGVVAC